MSKALNIASTLLPMLAVSIPLPSMAGGDEQLTLVTKINVGGKGLGAFDISFVDSKIGLYVLSDRTNSSVDFVDSHANQFLFRVSGFKGVVLDPTTGLANNNLSGPDGNTVINNGKEVWAGDGDSTVKVIDIASQTITDTIATGGKFRADEMGWDARDKILAVANDADTPPFITFINTDTHKVLGKLPFDGTNNTPNATMTGIEQTQWSPQTGLFYTSVPQTDPNNPASGGVTVIDPKSMQVMTTYEVDNCTPAGLALGPHNQALVGCSGNFGTAPNVTVQTVVIDITNGNTVNSYPTGGSDEVWFDPGTAHYYLGQSKNVDGSGTAMPVLGSIDALSMQLDQSVPSSTTAHSVAADKFSGHVFLPIGFVPPGSKAGTDPTNICPTNGCIAVYAPSPTNDDNVADR